jgi:hypothetical protein
VKEFVMWFRLRLPARPILAPALALALAVLASRPAHAQETRTPAAGAYTTLRESFDNFLNAIGHPIEIGIKTAIKNGVGELRKEVQSVDPLTDRLGQGVLNWIEEFADSRVFTPARTPPRSRLDTGLLELADDVNDRLDRAERAYEVLRDPPRPPVLKPLPPDFGGSIYNPPPGFDRRGPAAPTPTFSPPPLTYRPSSGGVPAVPSVPFPTTVASNPLTPAVDALAPAPIGSGRTRLGFDDSMPKAGGPAPGGVLMRVLIGGGSLQRAPAPSALLSKMRRAD